MARTARKRFLDLSQKHFPFTSDSQTGIQDGFVYFYYRKTFMHELIHSLVSGGGGDDDDDDVNGYVGGVG